LVSEGLQGYVRMFEKINFSFNFINFTKSNKICSIFSEIILLLVLLSRKWLLYISSHSHLLHWLLLNLHPLLIRGKLHFKLNHSRWFPLVSKVYTDNRFGFAHDISNWETTTSYVIIGSQVLVSDLYIS